MVLDTHLLIDQLPKEITEVTDAINKVGRAIIVGGYVRDALLQIQSHDIDIEVYDQFNLAIIEKALSHFAPIYGVGKSFGVLIFSYKNYHFDITLARKENKIGIGHKGFTVTAAPFEKFEIIAQRRDFTINAMGLDTKKHAFLDPFDGIIDLKNKRLNLVNEERFSEDPLRVLRALGFIARFDLQPSQVLILQSQTLIKQNILRELPKERIFLELQKWLLKAEKPSLGYPFLEMIHFDLLPNLTHCLKSSTAIREEILQALDRTPKSIELLWSVLYIKIPLPQSLADLAQISEDKKLIKNVTRYHKGYHRFLALYSHDDALRIFELKQLACDITLKDLATLVAIFDNKAAIWLKETAQNHNIFDHMVKPLVTGSDLIRLGICPSPEFKMLLQRCYTLQLKDPELSKQEILHRLKDRNKEHYF